ncbi:MAG TPA: hypothetical protein VGH87_29515 [Polyangiaceae bacterium]|jgi:hypothetical protein
MRSAFLALALFAATGCSAVVTGSPEEVDAQSTSVTGVIVIDRSSERGEASARFVRLHGAIDDGALRLVGAGLDLPAIGECSVVRDQTSSRSVELLDVGAISLESGPQHITLAQRQVPDVVDLVSGSVYSARIDEASVPSSADVAVMVAGSADVPAFSVRAKTPDAPANVRVAMGVSNVSLDWVGGSDLVYADVGGSRCTFGDEGHATIPASLFGDEGVVNVHRVRREKLSIPGLDGGELRFDFSRTVSYHR